MSSLLKFGLYEKEKNASFHPVGFITVYSWRQSELSLLVGQPEGPNPNPTRHGWLFRFAQLCMQENSSQPTK
jgi:hypothetical protein